MVVEADSLMYILGTTIDYKEDDIAAEFVFDNPLVCHTNYLLCVGGFYMWMWREFFCEIICLFKHLYFLPKSTSRA